MSRRRRPVRVAVCLHADAGDPAQIVEQRRRCRAFSEERGWVVTVEVVDLDRSRTQREWTNLDLVMERARSQRQDDADRLDGLVVSAVEQLGHSSGSIAKRAGELYLRGVHLSIVTSDVDGSTTDGAKVQAELAKLWAVDRASAARASRAGQADSAKRGVRLGAPRAEIDVAFVLDEINRGASLRRLAAMLGVSHGTIHNRVREELARREAEKSKP